MKLLMCHCQQCKHGRKEMFRKEVNHKKRRAKMRVRQLLRRGDYDRLPVAVVIGYTD